jgi:hypothetical protein
MLRTLRILAAATLLPIPALAAHPLVTDDTGTQGDRRLSLELNGEAARARADGALNEGAAVAAIVSMGAGDAVDLVIGVPAEWSRLRDEGGVLATQGGAADATLEAKWRFLERGGFSLAVKPGLSLPTGDSRAGLGAGSVGYGLALIATQTVGPLAFHVNGGISANDHTHAPDRSSTRHQTWYASAAAAAAVAAGLQVVANVGVESPGERGATAWPAFGLLGAIYAVGDALSLDLGVRTTLDRASPEVALLVGAAWRLGGAR